MLYHIFPLLFIAESLSKTAFSCEKQMENEKIKINDKFFISAYNIVYAVINGFET
jgi:putative lipase involved disintegration of autophagic bodies